MARDIDDKLRGCPTCGTPVSETSLGLRDYSRWLADALPGRASGSDIDCVVEQSKTGRILLMEFKPPGAKLPTGQRIMLRAFARKGMDVWVIWEFDDYIEAGILDSTGEVQFIQRMSVDELRERVAQWWRAGFDDTI